MELLQISLQAREFVLHKSYHPARKVIIISDLFNLKITA